ncbi:MAG: CoA-binding protein [Steroidobacteraceae bacterium]
MSDIRTLREIFARGRTVAVVGLSADWFRPSYFAAKYLKEHGFRVIPVNPRYPEILGERCYRSLRDIPDPIDIVDVFRKAADCVPIAEEAVEVGARVFWLQLGVTNPQAEAIAAGAGLTVVANRCIKIEYARLFGGLNWCGVNTGVISSHRPSMLPR